MSRDGSLDILGGAIFLARLFLSSGALSNFFTVKKLCRNCFLYFSVCSLSRSHSLFQKDQSRIEIRMSSVIINNPEGLWKSRVLRDFSLNAHVTVFIFHSLQNQFLLLVLYLTFNCKQLICL